MAFRFITLIVCFLIVYGVLGFGLYRLQIEKGFYYFERAQARMEASVQLNLRRGQLAFTDRYDKSIPVALNRDFPIIYAVPRDIKDPAKTASLLAPVVKMEEKDLLKAINNPKSLFKSLFDKATPEMIEAVSNLGLEGVYIDQKQYRFYPFDRLSSQVLGFVGVNEKTSEPAGLYGIEKLWNDKLSAGDDMKMTIDRNLQTESEQMLAELIDKYSAVAGTIIIQEPTTGKILTMASKPDFDPNAYKDYPIGNFINPAVQSMYEPGSVFKPFTMATGIETGVLTPDTTFVDTGSVTLNGKTIHNAGGKVYGKISMTNVIENSVNTGAVYAESLIGHENFKNYLKSFGFGQKTGIDLPDEISGSLKNLDKKDIRAIDYATAAFGQGTGVTPIQLVTAFSAIANGGVLMKPYIDAAKKPEVVRRVVSKETTAKVVKMMEAAVVKAGVASIAGFSVAGKTGTALIPDPKVGGYSDEMIHTYLGMVPASDPKFVILVKLDRPKVGDLAGLTVVPAFRELAQYVLNYYGIYPDQLNANNQ
jgi:cell division protein FtsI (penicillin-binding protein 3)